ncbi:MAG: TonB-dependent receptor [Bacteroidales bacterium]|nr:TonB-dependent receptor [Bacteroidales bacterium]
MFLRKTLYTLIVLCFTITTLFSQNITGLVIDSKTKEKLVGANVIIKELQRGISTNNDGYFTFENIKNGEYTIVVSFIGYDEIKEKINIDNNSIELDIELNSSAVAMEKIIITATRTERRIEDLAGQNEVMESKEIEEFPASSTDNLLQSIANINVNRSWGIFSKNASVTMRGLDAAQGVLVLYNGVPLNKTAGGSINWNMISPDRIEKIEVIKGPSSALYGNNAMGGVINIITKQPDKAISGDVRIMGGSYATLGGKFDLEGNQEIKGTKLYWGLSGFYRQGDGYVIEPKENRDSTDVEVYLKEYRLGATLGYEFNDKNKIEVEYSYYDDKRGDGKQVYFDDGGYVKYTTHFVRVKYNGEIGKFKIEADGYLQDENYYQFTEKVNSDGNYKVSKKDQISRDYGVWANATRKLGEKNWFTFGLDLKQGYMNASDIYLTSTDTLMREGRVQSYAAFLQDEHRLFNDKFKIIAGLRFDYARFYDGNIHVGDPTANTGFAEPLTESYDNSNWTSISPKLALQYEIIPEIKTYVSASTGFMPAKLDDLISSRKVSTGFKIANPDLNPQTLTNYEIGFNTRPFKKAQFKTAVYYSVGKDFQYFVETGNEVDGQREVTRENIAEIEIFGAEFFFQYDFTKNLTFKTNYTHNNSFIKKFDLKDYYGDDITGKKISEVPWHQVFVGLFWRNKYVNTTFVANYVGEMYQDEANNQIVDDYLTCDIRLSRMINENFFFAFDIQNIFNNVYVDKKLRLSPGRYILIEIAYKF